MENKTEELRKLKEELLELKKQLEFDDNQKTNEKVKVLTKLPKNDVSNNRGYTNIIIIAFTLAVISTVLCCLSFVVR